MNGATVIAVVLAVVVVATILALLVARNISVQVDPEDDYAALSPAPDAIQWGEGEDSSLWLDTNRNHVDLRTSSVALGVGRTERVFAGAGLELLGRGEGCRDFAVVSLGAEAIDAEANTATIVGRVERPPGSGAVVAQLRYRPPYETLWSPATPVSVGSDASSFSVPDVGGVDAFVVEVSDTAGFHEPTTRRISVNTIAGTATTDDQPGQTMLLPDSRVEMLACAEHDDVLVSLHGRDGSELARYYVDIGPAPSPTPRPTPTLPPDAGHATRRVCVDDDASRAVYLDGGESAGAAITAADFGGRLAAPLTLATLTDASPGAGHVYHFDAAVSAGAVQLTVNSLGASDTQGLDDAQVYPVRLTARDGTGAEARLEVGIWLDKSTESPNGNGRCS